jgi:uncharacterized protein (DUF1015 family)
MKTYASIGVQIPRFYLPHQGIDLTRWAVVACDQFTSQPEYWHQVESFVGEAPSTLNLIFPEVYLEENDSDERIRGIHAAMQEYLDKEILAPYEGILYLERTVDGKTRKGLVLCLDLECYSYEKGAKNLIRSTEGTIVERLPPRIRIREDAPIEVPHILVLIDDPQCQVIEPLANEKSSLTKLYDFDLMLDSGHLQGYLIDDAERLDKIAGELQKLADPEAFASKYDVGADQPVLLFAMGDGNHSLATAKAIWEKIKPMVGMDHPARYALVEIENVHDNGLHFAPIHRVLFNVNVDIFKSLYDFFGDEATYMQLENETEMIRTVESSMPGTHRMGVISPRGFGVIDIARTSFNLPVGTLQAFLDNFIKEGGADRIDYVHGEEVVVRLGAQEGNIGFYVPGMDKSDLFKTVILDGVLPRKTFSMGEAREKRFYMECRAIS